jgi:hypothetical protein
MLLHTGVAKAPLCNVMCVRSRRARVYDEEKHDEAVAEEPPRSWQDYPTGGGERHGDSVPGVHDPRRA